VGQHAGRVSQPLAAVTPAARVKALRGLVDRGLRGPPADGL